MALLWSLLAVAWLTPFDVAQQVILKNITDSETVIQYDGNCSEVQWVLNVEEDGLGISVFVNETTLDPDNEEVITLSADGSLTGEKSTVAFITGNISNVALIVPLTKQVFINFSTIDSCSDYLNYTLTILQYDVAVHEPEPTKPNPYPPTNFKTEILIYLAGKTLKDFLNDTLIANFQAYMFEAARNFTIDYSIPGFDSTKSPNETVFLRNPRMCSNKWDRYETCVEAMMAIYVTATNNNAYELTVTHLEKLWDEIGKGGLPLHLQVQPYVFADISTGILWWMLYLFIAIVVTIGLGYFFWRLQRRSVEDQLIMKEIEAEERRANILSQVQLRKKPNQFRLSMHQKIPEFMLNSADEASLGSEPAAVTVAGLRAEEGAGAWKGAATGPSSPHFTPKSALKSNLKLSQSVHVQGFSPLPTPTEAGDSPVFFSATNIGFQESDEEELDGYDDEDGDDDMSLRC